MGKYTDEASAYATSANGIIAELDAASSKLSAINLKKISTLDYATDNFISTKESIEAAIESAKQALSSLVGAVGGKAAELDKEEEEAERLRLLRLQKANETKEEIKYAENLVK